MTERSLLIEYIRGEIVGPSRPTATPSIVEFSGRNCMCEASAEGPLAWRPPLSTIRQEVLYHHGETPHRKYGAGVLHPEDVGLTHGAGSESREAEAAIAISDRLGVDSGSEVDEGEAEPAGGDLNVSMDGEQAGEDFEVTSSDIRRPSTLGVSFCVKVQKGGSIVVEIPQQVRFAWQDDSAEPFPVNGRYERCTRRYLKKDKTEDDSFVWRRVDAVGAGTMINIGADALASRTVIGKDVAMPENSPIKLRVEVFPRPVRGRPGVWLITVVLRNRSKTGSDHDSFEAALYQARFEVRIKGGTFEPYPESQRPQSQQDEEEKSLALLYRESVTWGIGHGCACGWEADPGETPESICADVLPAVEVPSMTPDITDSEKNPITLSMRELSGLSDDGKGAGWLALDNLASEYAKWLEDRQKEAPGLPEIAFTNLDSCGECLARIRDGIKLLRDNGRIRRAFRLTNVAMLLQQIATKQVAPRRLCGSGSSVSPEGAHQSPWSVFNSGSEGGNLGSWRAFQIAFLLLSIRGVADGKSPDRNIVDLIWFPTGGGKTEAYLGVMAFYMFHERLSIETDGKDALKRDGTNVLMRYTLRMLTTQQFQRAASLICAMEYLRRNPNVSGLGRIPGKRFSLGLWIGGEASPNKIRDAKTEMNLFRDGKSDGNPLILTECPWCRAQIGRYDGTKPKEIKDKEWNTLRMKGISEVPHEGYLLHCPDAHCEFGRENHDSWLPVEVIDERIYRHPPSLIIGTADKLAMVAYRPLAGALFGRMHGRGEVKQTSKPPGLIIQDELHLISGPLGTMYALYEGIFERLCSESNDGDWIKPKIVASTATIRGASDQVRSLYARDKVQLFPSPGLLMGDSFFGKYAKNSDGKLKHGRLYLGIHASDYGSVLTTQVRTFSSALFRPYAMKPEQRDPWWTLLVFYNSIRELGGAKTLFDSDIRSRLKFLFGREGFRHNDRRGCRIVEELTSRLSQAEIVEMMDRLSAGYSVSDNKAFDVCLASSIIEVGVDIDRLSLMGVVGQPKTTAQYIQVTGRVGRRWWERPGLILTVYNPSKSRDRSHYEQFQSYHRRLYEQVEPTSATPFALSAIQRALPGALILWARQQIEAGVNNFEAHSDAIEEAYRLLQDRCRFVQGSDDTQRSLDELDRVRADLETKWQHNPQEWETFPPDKNGEYLMLWPGQYATGVQQERGIPIPSSMRQVDSSAELEITQIYALNTSTPNPAP